MTDPQYAHNPTSNVHPGATDCELTSPISTLSAATNNPLNGAINHSQVFAGLKPPVLPSGTQSPDTIDRLPNIGTGVQNPDKIQPGTDEQDIGIGRYPEFTSTVVESAANRNLNSDTFALQGWPAPSGHFFESHLPIYETTGELIHEEPLPFEQFDNPAAVKQSSDTIPVPLSSNQSKALKPRHILPDRAGLNVFAQPAPPRSALKRKPGADNLYLEDAFDSRGTNPSAGYPGSRRSVSFKRMSDPGQAVLDEGANTPDLSSGQRASHNSTQNAQQKNTHQSGLAAADSTTYAANTSPARVSRPNRGSKTSSGHPPAYLPPEKVFPVQIGSELFRLSGASISSDAPSYFTQFFEEQVRQSEESQGVRTLYIDRDPTTFKDIARHLQGYHIKPIDGSHFVKLFADAQFYSLPRLIEQLFESEIFIQIGEQHFQIPKDIFSEPGNSPNFFSLGFAVFFSTPGEAFPGVDRRGLLRPPSITPPYVPGRSAEIFAQLLHLLKGYPLDIRNEAHRGELLRDCRYFHLRGLEQKIIAHEISYNLRRQKLEISLKLEDIKPSGISFTPDEGGGEQSMAGGWVYYARPFVDDTSYEVVIEIGGECTTLNLDDIRADFYNLTKARVASLFQVIANKMNLPTNAPLGLMMLSGGATSQSASPGHTPLSEDRVKVRFDSATDISLNGRNFDVDWDSRDPVQTADSGSDSGSSMDVTPTQIPTQTSIADRPPAKKRKRQGSSIPGESSREWTIRNAQWRLRVQPIQNVQQQQGSGYEIVFIGVKVDAFSNERARNARKSFLM